MFLYNNCYILGAKTEVFNKLYKGLDQLDIEVEYEQILFQVLINNNLYKPLFVCRTIYNELLLFGTRNLWHRTFLALTLKTIYRDRLYTR